MGFCEKWISFILACITSTKVYIIGNGNPTNEFLMEKGFRQGITISSFLFIIATKGHRANIAEAIEKVYQYRGESIKPGYCLFIF